MLTNDPAKPRIRLAVTGRVEQVFTLSPAIVKLEGSPGEDIKTVIKIVPQEKYAFKILSVRAKNGEHIRFHLDPVTSEDAPQYLLTVENTRTRKGRYFDKIFLSTDSTIRPEIKIGVFGHRKKGTLSTLSTYRFLTIIFPTAAVNTPSCRAVSAGDIPSSSVNSIASLLRSAETERRRLPDRKWLSSIFSDVQA